MSNQKEIWKDIKNYEEFYQVSNKGQVRRLDRMVSNGRGEYLRRGGILKPTKTNSHYKVELSKEGKKRIVQIQVLVAETFLDYDRTKTDKRISLINGNNKDCSLGNIQLVSWRENCINKFKNRYGYTGVNRTSDGGYSAKILINGKRVHIGNYGTPKGAGEAYLEKLKEVRYGNR